MIWSVTGTIQYLYYRTIEKIEHTMRTCLKGGQPLTELCVKDTAVAADGRASIQIYTHRAQTTCSRTQCQTKCTVSLRIGNTCTLSVARECTDDKRQIVAKQLFHSAETSSRHYEKNNTVRAAADSGDKTVDRISTWKRTMRKERRERWSAAAMLAWTHARTTIILV